MVPKNANLQKLEASIQSGKINTVLTVMADMYGRLMGKRITGSHFLKEIIDGGMHACAYLLTVNLEMQPLAGFELASWESGYQDFKLLPDWNTLRFIPWLPNTALILCDVVTEKGDPVQAAPRTILKYQIEKAEKLGLTVKTASELEFYLFKESFDSIRFKKYEAMLPSSSYIEDYHILQTSRDEGFISLIRNGMQEAEIPIESSKGEWGLGQQEINLEYSDALEMADRHVIYKNGVKEIADQNGVAVTFMAKYNENHAGSSFHLHSSLWDKEAQKSRFYDGAKPHGMSDLFRHYLAGQLKYAKEFSYFFAPTINSYKRYQAGSFAPTRIVWGRDNRTCGFRLVGEGQSLRVENRLPGADANPYLAFAATIAMGLKGMEQKLELPPEFSGDAYAANDLPRVPESLEEALQELEKSEAAKEAFGPKVVQHYLHAGKMECAASKKAVTSWELNRYFERI